MGSVRRSKRISQMDSFFALVSGSVAAAFAVVAPLVTRQRHYSTALNEQELQRLLERMPLDRCMSLGPDEKHKRRWTPTCALSCRPVVYCASMTTTTSDNDPNRQAFSVLVMRPCCLPGGWAPFDVLMSQTDAGDALGASGEAKPAARKAHVEMMHIEITHAELAYPCWTPMKRSLLAPGVSADDPCLSTAAALASEIHASLLPNGSGVFLIRGPKKTGKSSAAKLVAANHLSADALVCEQYDPTTPGHLLSLLDEVRNQRSPDAPLLVILEEVTWLRRIAHQKPTDPPPTPHASLKTEVMTKDNWNAWPERAAKIPNLIVVLTANFTDDIRAEFDALQEGSMLREERITAEFEMLPEGGFRRHRNHPDANANACTPPKFADAMVRDAGSSSASIGRSSSYDSASDDLTEPLI